MAKRKDELKPGKRLTAQVITPDDTQRMQAYLPNPDEVLAKGGGLEIYREMLLDPRIRSLLDLIKSAVLNFPFRLEQGEAGDEVLAFVQESALINNFYNELREVLSGLEYGYSVGEAVWELQDGNYILKDIVAQKPQLFGFNADDELVWLKSDGEVKLTEPYKWVIWQYDPEPRNPYGRSILQACYWPWKFKKAGLEFWLKATEKFAVPSLIALIKHEGSEEELQRIGSRVAAMLQNIDSGSSGAFANIESLETLSMSGKLADFKQLCDACDTQISYALAGASLAVQEGQYQARASSEVHQDMFTQLAKGIARSVQPVLQQVIDWMVALNFGTDAAAPQGVFEIGDQASFENLLNAVDRSVPVSKDAFYNVYGLPEPANEDDVFLKETNPFAGLFSDDDKEGEQRRPFRSVWRTKRPKP
jgi:phage gp29-like protein